MKNMFLVLNKEKIYAYVVSIMTIVTIFFMSSLINSDLKETEVTSSNSVENNAIGEAISTSIPYDANEDVKDKDFDSINKNTESSSTKPKSEETSSSINDVKSDEEEASYNNVE